MISEPMTWGEICALYPDCWVCVVEVEWGRPRAFDIPSARVVSHAKTRRELDDQTQGMSDRHGEVGRYFTRQLEVIMLSPPWTV